MRIIITSGYFNLLHKGHVQYLQQARLLGEKLICIINNDEQVYLKKSFPFMELTERLIVLNALKPVDLVFPSLDKDTSVIRSIQEIVKLHGKYGEEKNTFIFAKGGDRYNDEIPEAEICKSLKIKIVDGLGEKIQSSSDLIKRVETWNILKKKSKS